MEVVTVGLGLLYEGAPGVRVRTSSVTVLGASAGGVLDAALELAKGGATRIELCGGLGPVPQAAVQEAVGAGVAVGAVMFGFESLESAADYKTRFAAGEELRAAFLWRDPAVVDPDAGRLDHPDGSFVAVRDDEMAAVVAERLADEGVRLVELYGGLGAAAVDRIHTVTGGRLAIGVALYQGPPA
jgi:hypothetical protein